MHCKDWKTKDCPLGYNFSYKECCDREAAVKEVNVAIYTCIILLIVALIVWVVRKYMLTKKMERQAMIYNIQA